MFSRSIYLMLLAACAAACDGVEEAEEALMSAARGCCLGDEGGTGRTIGNKGGCGDHLHFQRQTSSSRSGTSTSISFTDAAVSNTSCQKTYTATTGGMSCIL